MCCRFCWITTSDFEKPLEYCLTEVYRIDLVLLVMDMCPVNQLARQGDLRCWERTSCNLNVEPFIAVEVCVS